MPASNEPAGVPLDAKNPMTGPLAERSNKLDFRGSDRADPRELNDILWLAVKGTTPPPRRSEAGLANDDVPRDLLRAAVLSAEAGNPLSFIIVFLLSQVLRVRIWENQCLV
jgi:hypothetical protein